MKAAFLFSGQLRGFAHCIDSMKEHLFSAFDSYDTFFYTPDTDGKILLDNWEATSAIIEKDQIHPEVPGFENRIGYSDVKSEATTSL